MDEVAKAERTIEEINQRLSHQRIENKRAGNGSESPKFLGPLTEYEIRKLHGQGHKVDWVPEDLQGMKEILKLSKVTQRLSDNWKDQYNRA